MKNKNLQKEMKLGIKKQTVSIINRKQEINVLSRRQTITNSVINTTKIADRSHPLYGYQPSLYPLITSLKEAISN